MNSTSVLSKAKIDDIILFKKEKSKIAKAGMIKTIRKTGSLIVRIRGNKDILVNPKEVLFL